MCVPLDLARERVNLFVRWLIRFIVNNACIGIVTDWLICYVLLEEEGVKKESNNVYYCVENMCLV